MAHDDLARDATLGVALAVPRVWPRVADYVALTKPRLNTLVVATTFAGFFLGAARPIPPWLLLHTILGTWCVASAAAAFNQVYERDTDRLMRRTEHRPVPDGRIQPASALRFARTLAALGVIQLAFGANLLAAAVALVTIGVYTLCYTPLKRHTPLATLVGGVPGALPPVIGWTAARGALSLEAAILFGIVFLWQMPHFLAIAWMCRDDYRRAGIPMLPVVEPAGVITALQIVLYSAVLVPVSLLPALAGLAGHVYLYSACALSLGFFALGLTFARRRDLLSARRLFLGSVTYLPLVWTVMLLNRM
jgi:protoheme IX farnesyltransferase